VDGGLLHLWHGALAARRYRERFDYFDQFDFDPVRDLTIGPTGAWRWNSDKPEMHQFVFQQLQLIQPVSSPAVS
jgi:hypothetical protein